MKKLTLTLLNKGYVRFSRLFGAGASKTSKLKSPILTMKTNSCDAVSLATGKSINSKVKIPAKSFRDMGDYVEPTVPYGSDINFSYIDSGARTYNCQIKNSFNPEVLPIMKGRKHVYTASNFDAPYGSIAIPATLDETLSTNGLYQCAAMAVVDRSQNLQTLIHFCPTVPKAQNDALLKHIFSHSNPKDLEVTLVPGCSEMTDNTIKYLVGFVNSEVKGAKLRYMHFPNDDYSHLVLRKGELMCAQKRNLIRTINPEDRIVFA